MKLFQSFPDLLFLDNPLYESFMVFLSVKPLKSLHHVVDFLLLFGSVPIDVVLLFEVKQFTVYYEIFPPDTFV
jgi:hypothetical protein